MRIAGSWGGKSRRFAVFQILADEDTPNARRAFADPRAYDFWIATSSLSLTWGLPLDWGELVQTHDDRAFFQAAPDELPAIDIHRL